ncbi:hypothetical protein GF324_08685, partial [bacterium]|nr:hypothetical protein [bacterium]
MRRYKLEKADKTPTAGLFPMERKHGHDRAMLENSFRETGEAVEELIRRSAADGGRVKGFKRGLLPFIGFLIAYEAHHRGHAMHALKQAKVKFDSRQRMALW